MRLFTFHKLLSGIFLIYIIQSFDPLGCMIDIQVNLAKVKYTMKLGFVFVEGARVAFHFYPRRTIVIGVRDAHKLLVAEDELSIFVAESQLYMAFGELAGLVETQNGTVPGSSRTMLR
jgi:hypothetical protein